MKFTSFFTCFLLSLNGVSSRLNERNNTDTSMGFSTSTCVCTTVPCPVVGANYLNIGGGGTGTYYYELHNSIPVVKSASVRLTINNMDKGTDTTSCTQAYSRSLDDDGVVDCDAGHILAHRLGGPGNQPINIFPQDLSVNRGAYAQYEDGIYTCITTKGASIADLYWIFYYSSTSKTKPINVTYDVKYYDGSCASTSKTFTN
jgi:hypothetical protein